MENIRENQKDVGHSVPAKPADVTLMAEHTELQATLVRIDKCLAQLKLCANGRDIEDEIAACVSHLEKRMSQCAERLARLAAMPGFAGAQANVQRARLMDMDFFLGNPEAALTRHHNMALAAMSAAQARVAAAWESAGLLTGCGLDRLRMTRQLLAPQAEAVVKRVIDRRRELAEEFPHILPMDAILELSGVEQSCSAWVVQPVPEP
ncbi:MAG: hypothetical protein ACYC9L_02990 [Sulfuricaulis sp.]